MYRIYLLLGSTEWELPVLPEKLEVKSPGENSTTTVLETGEINRLQKKGLREVVLESFWPRRRIPLVSAKTLPEPLDFVRAIQAWRDQKKPLRLLICGTDLDINTSMGIESFEYSEKGGEPGDIYYKLSLREHRAYGPKKVQLPAPSQKPVATVQQPARPGEAQRPRSYTIVSGDTLWGIAKRYYGDGAKWPTIYQANGDKIKNPNLIYPGQVVVIP